MLIAEPPIHVSPSLARVFGFNEAAVIQEIHFWLNPNVGHHFTPYFKDGRYWVPDIFDHLYQKFSFWDEDTIAYMGAAFEQSGILMMLEVEDPSQNSGRIIYHTLNYDVLREMSGATPVPASPFIDNIPGKPVLDMYPTFDAAANKNINMKSSFSAEIHKKTTDVYAMEAQDFPHFLACELLLEIQDMTEKAEGRLPVDGQPPVDDSPKEALKPDELLSREVICHFPKIFDVELKEFIWGDATLYKIIMVTFQMDILEEIFSFCEVHKASKMVIFSDNDDELGIYKDFLAHKDESKKINHVESKGREVKEEKSGIVIPVDREMLDVLAGFREVVSIKFRQVLRDGQKTNPAIQHYLNFRPLPDFDPQ